jgi:endonuclease VIII
MRPDMPEGPEIRRIATRLHKVLAGNVAQKVRFTQEPLLDYGYELSGQRVDSVSSRGKALLTHFEGGMSVYSHNQLYGRWFITKRDKPPRTNRTLRLAVHTDTHSALLFSACAIEVLTPEALALHAYLTRLGPDALDEQCEWRDILARLQASAFAGRSLGALYLDQSFVAGIGNYLRSEILHSSRVNPLDRPKDLSRRQLGVLARNTLALTRQAYETAGITNSPARVERLKARGIRRSRYRHLAFARAGDDCYSCGTIIERIDVSARRLYVCPTCQPTARASRRA